MFSEWLHLKRFVMQDSGCLYQILVPVLWLNSLIVDFRKPTLPFVEG